jgi:hypothetical protein
MPASGGLGLSGRWHAFADTIVATVAGGVVLLVFFPITMCAAGVKGAIRMARPHLVSQRARHITPTN